MTKDKQREKIQRVFYSLAKREAGGGSEIVGLQKLSRRTTTPFLLSVEVTDELERMGYKIIKDDRK